MVNENIIKIPTNAKVGDIIMIETLISHPMLIGNDVASSSHEAMPNKYIKQLIVKFGDDQIFNAELTPKISANPYVSFFLKTSKSGTLSFTWTENTGRSWSATRKLSVKS